MDRCRGDYKLSRIVSEEMHELILTGMDSSLDERELKLRIAKAMQGFISDCGINYLKVKSIIPARNFKDTPHTTEDIIYDACGVTLNLKEYSIEHGDGGKTYFYYQYVNPSEEHSVEERNLIDLFNLFFVLVGRLRSMTFMKRAMYCDGMTGILNETGIYRFVGEISKSGQLGKYNAYFINIKGMQMINDQYGSKVGDSILRGYARHLEEVVGDYGCAGRLGGDNFAVFLDRQAHNEFAEKMQAVKLLAQLPSGKSTEITLKSRIGYSELTDNIELAEVLTAAAVAKNFAGRNDNPDILRYSDTLLTMMRQKKAFQTSIPLALKNREFIVYYQPKAIYGEDGSYRLCGAEALIRWEKDGRMIMPGDFIPALEEMGLILDVDFYVFEAVCRGIKAWIEQGYRPVRVSSNFSQRHLQDSTFADKILETIRSTGVSPEFIEIEITESYDIKNLQKLTEFANCMHTNGIRLSVDDFGSGYASFSMIKNISADTIKLDKSLIDGIADGGVHDKIIVRNIIRMVEELGKDLIAEGVETEAQAKFLRECGCDAIQGYIYGKPMPEANFLFDYLSKI